MRIDINEGDLWNSLCAYFAFWPACNSFFKALRQLFPVGQHENFALRLPACKYCPPTECNSCPTRECKFCT